jgi:cell wall-associated NlpC family hydrolase
VTTIKSKPATAPNVTNRQPATSPAAQPEPQTPAAGGWKPAAPRAAPSSRPAWDFADRANVPASTVPNKGLMNKVVRTLEEGSVALVTHALYRPFATTIPKLDEAQRQAITSSLKAGDVLLETDASLPLWNAYESMGAGATGWAHAAMYAGNGMVIEAGGKVAENVHLVPLQEFLDTHYVAVLRPKYADDSAPQQAIDYAKSQLGKPYDGRFSGGTDADFKAGRDDNGAFYCSELVAKAIATAGVTVPTSVRINIPQAGAMVTPQSLLSAPNLEVVYKSGEPTVGGLMKGAAEGLLASKK